jgi:hypothetical protein
MRRTTLAPTALATLVAFSAGTFTLFAPRAAHAQTPPATEDEPQPNAPVPAPPPTYAPPPAVYAPPPGYVAPPGYAPPQPLQLQPPAYHYEERPRYGLVIAGASVFGALWITTALVGYSVGNDAAVIPVIGPLFYLSGSNNSDARFANTWLVFDSLVQATGVALFAAGFISKKKVLVPGTGVSMTLVPSGNGLAAIGTF